MGGDFIKIATSLIILAAVVAIVTNIIRNPVAANAVTGAGATTIAGVTADLEGNPVKG